MNAERLYAIATAIREDLRANNVDQTIQELIGALSNLSSQPQATSHQQQVKNLYETLNRQLTDSAVNSFPPIWHEALKGMGLEDKLGLPLLQRAQAVFAQNQLTPAVAAQGLQPLQADVRAVVSAMDAILSALNYLKVTPETLGPNEFEIGVVIPRAFVDNQLEHLGKELVQLEKLLDPFDELTTGTRSGFKVRTIASSDFGVFIDAARPVAAAVAYALQRIIEVYKSILEIRKLHGELARQNVPPERIEPLLQGTRDDFGKEIDKIAIEVVDEFYSGNDDVRKNQIRINIKSSLRDIAVRIDHGYNIEVRAGAPSAEDGEAPKLSSKEAEIDARQRQMIEAAAPAMKYLKAEGPPILTLAAPEEAANAAVPTPPKQQK